MRRLIRTGVLTAMCLAAGVQARADAFVNPWAGVNFGSDINEGRASFGVGAGWMGAGIIGGEAVFGYSPSFFGTDNDFGNNTVIDFMGNVIVGIPIGGQRGGGFRPYVTGGLGLLRTQIDGGTVFNVKTSDNDLGWNAGAGAMGFFNDHFGVRGDIRYLRNLTGNSINHLDLGDLKFWRLSAGVVIR